jgi:hypothetical protein
VIPGAADNGAAKVVAGSEIPGAARTAAKVDESRKRKVNPASAAVRSRPEPALPIMNLESIIAGVAI